VRRSWLASDGVATTSAADAFERLRPVLHGRLLLASDFDGTLAPLVPDPWSAAIVPGAQRALRRLAAAPDVDVALISGRTVADLAARARVGGVEYRGDHGSERATAARGFRASLLKVDREAADPATVAMARRLKEEVPRQVDEPWLVLEDKGPALTFHFRTAPDTDAARERVMAAADAVDPVGVLYRAGGRRAYELRPHGATTKDTALRQLIDERRPDVVVMLGDDRHDALAFDVLRAAREDHEIDGLAVGVASRADVGAVVAARADLMLADPYEAARLLSLIARRHAAPA
jgi:trehalose 6-phosphate phosphatase